MKTLTLWAFGLVLFINASYNAASNIRAYFKPLLTMWK